MNADIFSDAEVLAILNKALNGKSEEEKQEERRNRARKSKADFCNLQNQEAVFIEA